MAKGGQKVMWLFIGGQKDDVAVYLRKAWLQDMRQVRVKATSHALATPLQATATASLYESGALVKADCA